MKGYILTALLVIGSVYILWPMFVRTSRQQVKGHTLSTSDYLSFGNDFGKDTSKKKKPYSG